MITEAGRNLKENTTAEVRLFDQLPKARIQRQEQASIWSTFDGSFREFGLAVELEPDGRVRHVQKINLLDGNVVSYDLNSEGKWRSKWGVINSDPAFDKKLRAVAEDVQKKFKDWKWRFPRVPIHNWSTFLAKKKAAALDAKLPTPIRPDSWYNQFPLSQAERNSEKVA